MCFASTSNDHFVTAEGDRANTSMASYWKYVICFCVLCQKWESKPPRCRFKGAIKLFIVVFPYRNNFDNVQDVNVMVKIKAANTMTQFPFNHFMLLISRPKVQTKTLQIKIFMSA